MALAQVPVAPITLRPHPHLYEINTWVWLEQLAARLGRATRLGDVPDAEWDAIAKRGFDVVWLMGVWKRSPESRRITLEDPANFQRFDRALPGWKLDDVIGSPYAVTACVPDPRIGNCYVSEVALNPGGKSARVYVAVDSAVKDIVQAEKDTIAGLEAAKGFIRYELKERMGVRNVPELSFLADRSGRFQARIVELMDRSRKRQKVPPEQKTPLQQDVPPE